VDAGAKALAGSGLTITTVCQANASTMPRLKDGGCRVTFEASGRAIVSAGPTLPQAKAHVVEGASGTPRVTLALGTPRGEPVLAIYAAAHLMSGNPPDPKVKYHIDWSADGGRTWIPVAGDWTVNRQADEPRDFWSQSFCWGSTESPADRKVSEVWVRFWNDGGKAVARAEVHLAYRFDRPTGHSRVRTDATEVTFAWTDDRGEHTARQEMPARDQVHSPAVQAGMNVPTGTNVRTKWVEFRPLRGRERDDDF
jgi:hypothetical protein